MATHFPWRREQLPTPIFLPGESMDKRSLVGYSPWGPKESDPNERLTLCLFFFSQHKGTLSQRLQSRHFQEVVFCLIHMVFVCSSQNLKAFGQSIHFSIPHTPHHPYIMLLHAFGFTTSLTVKIVPENRFEKFHVFFFCDFWNSISNEKSSLSHLFCCFAFAC